MHSVFITVTPLLPTSVCVSAGLPEEREGQRPPVRHRGVSPQGRYLSRVSWPRSL